MRIVRLLAVLGSLTLLVATTVSLMSLRADIRSVQIRQVESATDVVSVAVRANVEAARNAVEVAGTAAVSAVDARPALARRLASSWPSAEACVGVSVGDCTGEDLFALPQLDQLTSDAAATEDAIVAIDAATSSAVFVYRPESVDDPVTVIVRVPVPTLLSDATRTVATARDVEIELEASSRSSIDVRDAARMVDGDRVVDATVGDPFVDGSISARTSINGVVGLAGGRPVFYGSLLALGTVLLAVAGWTFLHERRLLERRASTDVLTGLVNRREFESVATETLDTADRFGTGACVMVIDLNGFKQVNDTMGHQFGDLVLKASAERLVEAVRDTDVVGRWGGDEFVILLPGLEDRTAIRNSAERISAHLSHRPVVERTTMSASIGAAIFPRHGTDLQSLMRAADVAMYEAKATGVHHRIADTIAAQDELAGADVSARPTPRDGPAASSDVAVVHSDDYDGPDRRRSPTERPPVATTPRGSSPTPTPSPSPATPPAASAARAERAARRDYDRSS